MDPVSPSHHPKIVLTILSLTLSACGTATFAGGGGRKSGEKKPTAPVATSATPVAPGVPPGPATIPVGDVATTVQTAGSVSGGSTPGTARPSTARVAKITANGVADRIIVGPNDAVTIAWTSQNTTNCQVAPLTLSGTSGTSLLPVPVTSAVYTLRCATAAGEIASSVVVQLDLSPGVGPDLKAEGGDDPLTVAPYGSVTLSWSTDGVDDCALAGGLGTPTPGGQVETGITAPVTYTLVCTIAGAPGYDAITVNVDYDAPPVEPPTPDPSVAIPDPVTPTPDPVPPPVTYRTVKTSWVSDVGHLNLTDSLLGMTATEVITEVTVSADAGDPTNFCFHSSCTGIYNPLCAVMILDNSPNPVIVDGGRRVFRIFDSPYADNSGTCYFKVKLRSH